MSKKGVQIALLKAQLSKYLKQARNGQQVTVLDRETPIAMIVPMPENGSGQLELIPPEEDPATLSEVKGKALGKVKRTSLEILMEDRDSR